MAKRKAEVDDDGKQRAVFVDTTLDTHLVLVVSPTDTFSLLKQKILDEHPKCFSHLGEIKINALKVKRRGCYYHLLDSMLVRTAFYGVAKNWFLLAETSSQVACSRITSGPSKTLPALLASSEHLESGINCNKDDHFGNHSSDVKKMLVLEMPNKFDQLNAGEIDERSDKKSKKKRKRTGEQDNAGDENGERLEDLSLDCVGKEPPSTRTAVKNVGDDMKSTDNITNKTSPSFRAKKKHRLVSKDAQEVSLLKTKSVISDSNRVDPQSEVIVGKNDQDDLQRSGTVDVNELPSLETSKDTRKEKREQKHASSERPSSKANKKENLMDTDDHAHNAFASAIDTVAKLESVERITCVQSSASLLEDGNNNPVKDVQEGTKSHYQLEGEIEIDKIGLAPESRAKKIKKTKKGDVDRVDRSNATFASKMPDIPKDVVAPTQNESTICGQDSSVTESMELGASTKKKKVKKVKVATIDNTDLSSIEKNNGDNTHQIDKKRNLKVKTSSTSRNADQEADDTGKIGAESLQTPEINKAAVGTEIRAEKSKRKTQKKQTVSIKDSSEVSVKEQSDEKIAELDIPKTANADLLVNGDVDGSKNLIEPARDLHEDVNKTLPTEVSADVAELRKTEKPRTSKKKVKKHNLPSSIDASCSGHNMITLKERRGSERTAVDADKLKNDDQEAECKRRIDAEPLQPLPINIADENMETTRDKTQKRDEKKQTALEDPPKSPMKQQFDEKRIEEAVLISADGDLLANVVNDATNQGEVSPGEDHDEKFDDSCPSDSAGLAEVRNQDKPHASKDDVKKLDLPSSIDTSSNQSSLGKSKKSKENKRSSQNRTQLQESINDQQQDISMTQPREKPSGTYKEGIDAQAPLTDPDNSLAKVTSLHHGSKLSGASSMTSPVRKTHQGKKAKEPQKKPDKDHTGSKRSSRKNMGEVVNASLQKKGLLATPGAIFEDGSSASSDDIDKMDGSDVSTRTPSDNLSSSDYSEGESKGHVVTSHHDASKGGGLDGTNLNSSDLKNMTIHSILRSSSRYRIAKVVASQSQLEDSGPPEFVPDSQANP